MGLVSLVTGDRVSFMNLSVTPIVDAADNNNQPEKSRDLLDTNTADTAVSNVQMGTFRAVSCPDQYHMASKQWGQCDLALTHTLVLYAPSFLCSICPSPSLLVRAFNYL